MAVKQFTTFADFKKLTSTDKELSDSIQAEYEIGNVKDKNKKTYPSWIARYAKSLKSDMEAMIRDHYNTYEPTTDWYVRTYQLQNSINEVEHQQGAKVAYISFNDNAIHPNYNKSHDSFVPILMSYGWSNFGHFDGIQFIQKAIDNFNKKYKDYGVQAALYYDGEPADMDDLEFIIG